MIRIALRHLVLAASVVTFASAVQAATGSPAAALGPEAVLVEPSGGFEGRLALQPDHGPIGTPITVSGSGLPPGTELDLVWRTSTAKWNVVDEEYHGREYTPVGYVVAKITTDDQGGFSASFDAPDDFGFWHDITVQDGERVYTQAAFYIDMTVDISPESGPVGTPITVDVKGIGRQQLQNSWLLLYDNKYTGWMSSVNTAGSAHFTIPASGMPGTHVLEVLHGDFTFPYRNMQQSPEPNRPRFVLPFQIVEGDPVLPPSPDMQLQTSVRGLAPQGDLAAEPTFATVGQPVTVSGEGFEPGKSYELYWSTVSGNRVSGSGWETSERVIAEAAADASGKLVFAINTPDDLGGSHTLRVEDKVGTFWIAPSAAALSVDSGVAGTTFTVSLKGVGWTETANIYAVVYDNAYIGYACGFNSQGTVDIFLQATGEPGWHFIDLYPAIYKGKEGRPNNFRLPQLTYEEDHPGEDLPRFSFAFEITDAPVN